MWLIFAILNGISILIRSFFLISKGAHALFIIQAILLNLPILLFLIVAHIIDTKSKSAYSIRNAGILKFASWVMLLLTFVILAKVSYNIAQNFRNDDVNYISIISGTALVGFAFIIFYKTLLFYLRNSIPQIVAAGYLREHYESIKTNDMDKAKEYLHKAHEYNPNSIFILGQLALSHQLLGNNADSADECIGKARQLLGRHKYKNNERAAFEHNVGQVLFARGLYGPSIECFRKAAELEPKTFRTNNLNEKLATAKKLAGYDIS